MTAKGIGTAAIVAAVVCTTSSCDSVTDVSQEEVETASDPGQVTDLAAIGSTTNSVTVSFTEVDDGTRDPANYALRYGSPTISWGSAQPTEVAIEGSEIGNKREYQYDGLEPGAEYEFRLVAYRGTLNAGATFGELSNGAPASTEAVEAGEPASITLTPESATIWGIGNTRQFSAEVRDADGNTLPDPSIEWSTSDPQIATVTQEGLVEATDLGTVLVIAAAMCGNVACAETESPVDVENHEPSDRYPNEPAGYEPWFEHDWSWFDNVRANMPKAATGTGWFSTEGWSGGAEVLDLYQYVEDPSGPHGYPGYVRRRIPEGQLRGSSGGSFTLKSANESLSSPEGHKNLKEMYVSFWIYWEPHPEEGGFDIPPIYRQFTINRHVNPNHDCQGTADFIWGVAGSSSSLRTSQPTWRSLAHDTCRDVSSGWRPVTTPGELGTWHHLEFRWRRVSGGMSESDPEGESRFTIWQDGELLDDWTQDHRMIDPVRQWFYNPNPTGGNWPSSGTDTKGRDDHYRITGIYISGIPN